MKASGHAQRIFAEVSASLRHSYLLGYQAPQIETPGWRTIRLVVNGIKRPRVRAKSGYQVSR